MYDLLSRDISCQRPLPVRVSASPAVPLTNDSPRSFSGADGVKINRHIDRTVSDRGAKRTGASSSLSAHSYRSGSGGGDCGSACGSGTRDGDTGEVGVCGESRGGSGNPCVGGLITYPVESAGQVMELVRRGASNRRTGSTQVRRGCVGWMGGRCT